jgi:hypothetical protein
MTTLTDSILAGLEEFSDTVQSLASNKKAMLAEILAKHLDAIAVHAEKWRNYGESLPEIHALITSRDKALAFKTWVHKYLDDRGVPHDPMAERTAKTGCRISARLDWLFDAHAEGQRIATSPQRAIDRSGLDISPCKGCSCAVVCIPDGLPFCEACATKESQR